MEQLGALQETKGTHWVRGQAWHEDKAWGELSCRNAHLAQCERGGDELMAPAWLSEYKRASRGCGSGGAGVEDGWRSGLGRRAFLCQAGHLWSP